MRERVRRVFGLFAFVFIFWGCYRLIFKLPENFEELVLKPIFWLGPTFWLTLKVEKETLSSLGITTKNLFKSLYLGLGLGAAFLLIALIGNFLKFQSFDFASFGLSPSAFLISFGLSLATAVSEEIVFRGYLFSRLRKILKNQEANLLTGLLFVLIHLPISIFQYHYSLVELVFYASLVLIFSLGSGFLLLKTENLASSILAHVLWSWSIALFR